MRADRLAVGPYLSPYLLDALSDSVSLEFQPSSKRVASGAFIVSVFWKRAFMKPDTDPFESMLARLHLRAVLPTLVELTKIDATAKELVGTLSFSLRFKSKSGIATTLQFDKGALSIDPDSLIAPPLQFFFPSDKQINNLFLKRGFPIILPNWRIWKLIKMPRFQKLSARLERILKAAPDELRANPELLETHIHLLLTSLIPRAFIELARNERYSKETLSGNAGLIQLQVVDTPIQSWLDCQSTDFAYGSGQAPRSPDLFISFQDLETALLSTRNELDALAAVSGGEIKLEGNIPLADAANAVLDRISVYLTL